MGLGATAAAMTLFEVVLSFVIVAVLLVLIELTS